MQKKYPEKKITDTMKHLFHGTSKVQPKMIYASEDGFDIRFSNPGAYGNGIYFADNSGYSNNHGYTLRSGEVQMFMALVLVGDSVEMPKGLYKIPPLKPGSEIIRYDSINNGFGGHYIIYDNDKAYPGYLITYRR